MPLYEYECDTCQKTVELLLRSSSEQPVCPDCGETKLKKLLSVPAGPAVRDGLPVARDADIGQSCGAPRCCGGGCDF